MAFRDNIPGIMTKAFTQVATDTATYTSVDDDVVPDCDVRLDHDVILQPSGYDAQIMETGSTITALYSDVGEPEKGATFLIGSTTYTVQRITDNDRVFVTMVVKDAS